MRDKGKGRKVVDINRRVFRIADMPEELIRAIEDAEPSERSRALGRRIPRPADRRDGEEAK